MSARNVLVVALHPGSEEHIKDAIEQRHAVDEVNVRIVAPASTQTPLQWLMGDEDPARAEAEVVADFPADEIVVAGQPDEKTEMRLRRFGLPVERLDRGHESPGETEEVAREIARGRSAKTPLVVITGVGAVILGAAALLSLLLFLVLWLV